MLETNEDETGDINANKPITDGDKDSVQEASEPRLRRAWEQNGRGQRGE